MRVSLFFSITFSATDPAWEYAGQRRPRRVTRHSGRPIVSESQQCLMMVTNQWREGHNIDRVWLHLGAKGRPCPDIWRMPSGVPRRQNVTEVSLGRAIASTRSLTEHRARTAAAVIVWAAQNGTSGAS